MVHLFGFYCKNKRNKHAEFQGQNRLIDTAADQCHGLDGTAFHLNRGTSRQQ